MSVLANCSILSVGMGMAFPSVSITAMTNTTDYMSLEEHEFSWFGKCCIRDLLINTARTVVLFVLSQRLL